jgi:prolyl oligopeptidase
MAASTESDVADPHKWLEEVLGEKQLDWVKERNAEVIGALGDPKDTEMFRRILAILDSKDKIPRAFMIRDNLYNFWQDSTHVQGIWRKCTLDSYRTASPAWTTIIDVDAMAPPTTDTAKTWVWHGSKLLDEGAGKCDRAIISLSPGGSDADTNWEFDLVTESRLKPDDGGFVMPIAAKTDIQYRTRDEVLVGTDFGGDGSCLTDSGYPRVVRSWRRGTPIEDAVTVFEGEQTDVAASQYAYHDRGFVHEIQCRSITFYTSAYKYRRLSVDQLLSTSADKETTPFGTVPIPNDATFETFAEAGLITLRSDWKPPGLETTFPAGALLSVPLDDLLKDTWNRMKMLFEPTDAKSLESKTDTKDYIILNVLEHVRTKLVFWKYNAGTWELQDSGSGADAIPVGEGVDVACMNRFSDVDNSVYLTRAGFLIPDTLELASPADGCMSTEKLKAKPAMFDASGLCVEQHFVQSLDGTQIPYFVIRRTAIPFDGSTPTLLDAYGGFEISETPYYSAGVGAGWLERGGAKVIANIRGGGEYGPKWHQAALQEKRHKAYEDVEAVAKDLIDRKITSPAKLAVIGGSNGGLMVGNMLCRPTASSTFGAAVCQVPLLDMKVYSKLLAGASWMAEYGNPDIPEQWAFLRRHSAYQMLRHDCLGMPETGAPDVGGKPLSICAETGNPEKWICPKVLFTTSTRDDRVHPGHARKMVAALQNEAAPKGKAPLVYYWENIEGGHGGAADNKQRAHMWALTYAFLARVLEVS